MSDFVLPSLLCSVTSLACACELMASGMGSAELAEELSGLGCLSYTDNDDNLADLEIGQGLGASISETTASQGYCGGCDRPFIVVSPSPSIPIMCIRCLNLFSWLHGYDGCDESTVTTHLSDPMRKSEFKQLSIFKGQQLDRVEPPKRRTEILEEHKVKVKWSDVAVKFQDVSKLPNADLQKCAKFEWNGRTFYGLPNKDIEGFPTELTASIQHHLSYAKRTVLNDGSFLAKPEQQDIWFNCLALKADAMMRPGGALPQIGQAVESPASGSNATMSASIPTLSPQRLQASPYSISQYTEGTYLY